MNEFINKLAIIVVQVASLTLMSDKSPFYGMVRFKGGGQPCFSKIPNWPSLKLHIFFDFNLNNPKSVKIPAKLTNFFHPAKFWDPQPGDAIFFTKNYLKKFTAKLSHFLVTKKSCKKMASPRWSFAKVLQSWRVTS